jgi:hypothetical protein
VVSRDELTGSQLDELAALDAILAREPVGEEHLELAALVDSVRAGAPRMDPAFAERLDARLAGAGRSPRTRRRPRGLAFAGGGLVAAAVAFTIVISSGVLGGGSHAAIQPLGGPGPGAAGSAFNGTTVSPRAGAVAPGTPAAAGGSTHISASSGAAPSPGTSLLRPLPAAAGSRLVRRASTLTLATSPATMQGVANQIVADTEQQGGVVESSSVEVQGSSSYANFSLQVPSGHLTALIATLSGLASVRALNQTTADITDVYNTERARLADSEAERSALRKELASAATAVTEASAQQQLSRVEARINAEQRRIGTLETEGRTASLQVNVVPGAGSRQAPPGPFTRAFDRALHALQEILAIALIALAIMLPIALSAIAVWWGAVTVRQRARERAMRTA